MNINFIYTGGDFTQEHFIAVASAIFNNPKATVTLWSYYDNHEKFFAIRRLQKMGLVLGHCQRPILRAKLVGHFGKLMTRALGAIYKDLVLWELGYEHGGIFMDLDTISIAPFDHLFTDDIDLLVGQDIENEKDCRHPWNNAIVAIRAGSDTALLLRDRSQERAHQAAIQWGDTGPALLTSIVRGNPRAQAAPFRVLGGFGGHERGLLVDDKAKLPVEALVIHTFSLAATNERQPLSSTWVSSSTSPMAIAIKTALPHSLWFVWDVERWLELRGVHYRPMFEYLANHEVKNILEIGTYSGENAVGMIQTSGADESEISYWGFDVFEEPSPEFIDDELSFGYHKPPSVEAVYRFIHAETKARVFLEKGLSTSTLPMMGGLPTMDFIYIDGGHSIETIAADWKNVQGLIGPDTLVVFDDVLSNLRGLDCGECEIGASFLTEVLDPNEWTWELVGERDSYEKFDCQLLFVRRITRS